MLTKADFLQKTSDIIGNYPSLVPFFQVKDPRLMWQLESNAAMLAALSAQIETAMTESFEKARDATILADAAMRGIVPKARPCRVQILAKNENSTAFTIETGRVIFDSKGNDYIVSTPVTIPANSAGLFEASQIKVETLSHAVVASVPFYAIEIPASDDGSFLSALSVRDSKNIEYIYRERYVNVMPNELVYHIEVDDRQRVYIRFGQKDIVATQPKDGDIFIITIYRSVGELTPAYDSTFSFDYNRTTKDTLITLKMSSLIDSGQNPMDMITLSDLSKYPSTYDHNSVYLGEFDFLVRHKFTTLQFLSVWNESIEELAHGASVDNINKIFIAVLSKDGVEITRNQPSSTVTVNPVIISPINYTATQKAIKSAIKEADDSYGVVFYTLVRSEIKTTITASVSTSYVASDVKYKIIEVLLAEYSESSSASKRGANQPLYREIYALLKDKIPALSDGRADLKVTIEEPTGILRPELWRYISVDSLHVTVSSINIIQNGWGGR